MSHVGLLPSKARIADASSAVISASEKYEAAHIVVDVTAGTGFNLSVAVKGRDLTSGKDYTLGTSSTINATGTTIIRVGPQYAAAANIFKEYLPDSWSVAVTQSGGASATYSIGASLI